MSYSSMMVPVSPNNNIAVCFSQSECNLHSMLLGASAAAEANLILIKVLSKSNTSSYGPSMQAHKMWRFALAEQLQGKRAVGRSGWCASCYCRAAAASGEVWRRFPSPWAEPYIYPLVAVLPAGAVNGARGQL